MQKENLFPVNLAFALSSTEVGGGTAVFSQLRTDDIVCKKLYINCVHEKSKLDKYF